EVATVDQLSEGRFDFGVGRSGSPRAYDALGIPYGESQARFVEALEIIREAWKGESFSYRGRFHRFEDVRVTPGPYQQPHPPTRMAANPAEPFPSVGRPGLPLFVGLRDLDVPELTGYVRAYRAAWREAGHAGEGDVCLRIPVYAGLTEREAVEEPRENIEYFLHRHTELARAGLGRADTRPAERRPALGEKPDPMGHPEGPETPGAFGP